MHGTLRSLVGVLASAMLAGVCFGQLPLGRLPAKEPDPVLLPKVLDQESLPLLESKGYAAAKEEAKKKHRLMLVFWSFDDPSNPRWSLWRNRNSLSLRAWIKWHGVAIWMQTLPPELVDEACMLLKQQFQTTPAVLILRDGRIERIEGTEKQQEMGLEAKRSCPKCNATATECEIDRMFVPKPLRVLYQADFAMDRIAARDPVWVETHNQMNPPPAPPLPGEPASMIKDELAPPVYDPRPEEKIGALDRLDEARRLMKSGDLYQATGVYTWLWERGAAVDPAFRPARLSALAQDIDALVAKRPGAAERFEKIRAARNARLPWADYGEMHEWFVLNGVTRHGGDTVDVLNYYINDTSEGTLATPPDMMAYNLLTRREDFTRAWELPKDAVGRVRAIAERVSPRFPAQVQEKERGEYVEFARQFLLDEGCRLYVACLKKGDEAQAQRVAEVVLKTRNDAAARLSLITTALSAEPQQARAIHVTWLDEAEAESGVKRPDLRNRLTLGARDGALP